MRALSLPLLLVAACASTPAEVTYDEGLGHPLRTPFHEAWLDGDSATGWTIELVRRDRAGGPTFLAFSDAVVEVIRIPVGPAGATRPLTYEAVGSEAKRFRLGGLELEIWEPGRRARGRFTARRLEGGRRIDLHGRFDARVRP